MPFIKGEGLQGETVNLYFEDLGKGQPVILIHGWPLSGDMWEYQVTELLKQGLRCITYDRRGFGKSSRPLHGYDYDTFAADLNALINELQLHDVVLVGFSMGGGEVVRYLSKYGGSKIAKAVLVSAVTPFMLKTEDNPNGVEEEVFAGMLESMQDDRIAFLDDFGKQFFGINFLNHPVSAPLLEYYRMLAAMASPVATQECAKAFAQTDFRPDLQAITGIPFLIIHGDSDKTVPIDVSGNKTAAALPGAEFIVYEGAPHGLFYTHRKQLNEHLLQFISGSGLSAHATDDEVDILPSNNPLLV